MHDILIQVYFIMEQKSVYLVAGQRTSNKIVIGPYPILRKSFQGFKLWKWGEKWQLQGYLLEEGTKPEPRLVDEMSWYQDCCYHRKQKFHKSLTIP